MNQIQQKCVFSEGQEKLSALQKSKMWSILKSLLK